MLNHSHVYKTQRYTKPYKNTNIHILIFSFRIRVQRNKLSFTKHDATKFIALIIPIISNYFKILLYTHVSSDYYTNARLTAQITLELHSIYFVRKKQQK